jgi:polysaccharide biosynthesis protein PslG
MIYNEYMKKRRKKIIRRTKKSNNFFTWLSISSVILIVVGFAIKQVFFPPVLTVFHGPHLSKELYDSGLNLNQGETLGARIKRNIFRITPTPIKRPTPTPTQKPIPTPTPIPPITNTPIPTPTAMMIGKQFGIAAGSILSYFNQTDLDLYFSQLKELGVTWVRYDFEWGLIQKNDINNFDWLKTDSFVQTANKYGIKTLGTIAYAPVWARLPACSNEFACAPEDPNAYGIFAGQVAARYVPMGIHYWEIWNEPNIKVFWKPKPDVNSYVAILKSAYLNIKKVDTSAVVLVGGLSPAGDENNNIAPITFIRTLYEQDTTKDFDGIAIHPYSYPALASYIASWNCWQQMDSIRQIMTVNGDSNKPLWLTEYGAPTSGPGSSHNVTQLDNYIFGSDYMTEDAQATMISDALSLYSQLNNTGPFFWYSLKDAGTSTDTPENFFGLIRFDNSKKPAYEVFKNAIVNR